PSRSRRLVRLEPIRPRPTMPRCVGRSVVRGGLLGSAGSQHRKWREPDRVEEGARPRSDALVLFGITGDLAYQKIVPALQEMVRHRNLAVPVVGVARSGWSGDSL